MIKNIKQSLLSVIIGLALVAGISYAAPWVGPTNSPPNGNVPAPINTGSSNQTFTGSKVIKMKDDNTGVFSLFGALRLTGRLQIADGTEGAGKVLTSDADGLASWQTGVWPNGFQTSYQVTNIGMDGAGAVFIHTCPASQKVLSCSSIGLPSGERSCNTIISSDGTSCQSSTCPLSPPQIDRFYFRTVCGG